MNDHQLMTEACCKARIIQMGLYASGPYTRINFFWRIGALLIKRGPVDDKGTLVQTLTTEI